MQSFRSVANANIDTATDADKTLILENGSVKKDEAFMLHKPDLFADEPGQVKETIQLLFWSIFPAA